MSWRIAWAAWSLAWAMTWLGLTWLAWPHRVCSESMLFVTGGGSGCLEWGTAGSIWWAVVFLSAAAGSLAAGIAGSITVRKRA